MNRCRILLLVAAVIGVTGCPGTAPPPTPPAAATRSSLRVMVVDDPPLAAAVAREWLAHTEEKLEVIEVTRDQALLAQQLPVDVVLYEPALLGQFAAADLLVPLDEAVLAEPEYKRDEILSTARIPGTTWGRQTFAVPLGAPQLVLFYRADLFADQKLKPPQTWQEYSELVQKFAQKPASVEREENLWRATVEPLADGWAAKLLLARGASSALDFETLSPLWNFQNFEPRIAGPAWIRTLEQLVQDQRTAQGSAGRNGPLLSPADCCAKFLTGEAAMAITWPQAAGSSPGIPGAPSSKLRPEQVGMVLLPGSDDVFDIAEQRWAKIPAGASRQVPLLNIGGRVGSVSRASSQSRLAIQFLLWLSGPAQSGRILPASSATTVFRTSHVPALDGSRPVGTWQADESIRPLLGVYAHLLGKSPQQMEAEHVPRTASARQGFVVPRMPGQQKYLAALNAAVLASVQEDQSATESLQTAADEWQKISTALGLDKQQSELRRSLGL